MSVSEGASRKGHNQIICFQQLLSADRRRGRKTVSNKIKWKIGGKETKFAFLSFFLLWRGEENIKEVKRVTLWKLPNNKLRSPL